MPEQVNSGSSAGGAANEQMSAALPSQGNVADELQTVADALLGMNEQRASCERRAVPAGLGKIARVELRAADAVFVVGESARKIPHQQASHSPAAQGLRIAGLQGQRGFEVLDRSGRIGQILDHGAQIHAHFRHRGSQPGGLLELGPGFLQTAQRLQRDTEIAGGGHMVGALGDGAT